MIGRWSDFWPRSRFQKGCYGIYVQGARLKFFFRFLSNNRLVFNRKNYMYIVNTFILKRFDTTLDILILSRNSRLKSDGTHFGIQAFSTWRKIFSRKNIISL